MTATAGPDHLVVAAVTLDEGVAWCEAPLGMSPGRQSAGGRTFPRHKAAASR